MEFTTVQLRVPKETGEMPGFLKVVEELAEEHQRAFFPEDKPSPVTLAQGEAAAAALGGRIGREFLQQSVERQMEKPIPANAQAVCCPRCGKPASAVAGGKPGRREVTTRVGRVKVSGTPHRCAICRIAFFPSAPPIGPAAGKLQPCDPEEGRI
jgi:hypothetical protein